MAAVTYPMRAGGYWLMGHGAADAGAAEAHSRGFAGNLAVIATVLPLLFREGIAAAAIAAALLVTLVKRNDFVHIARRRRRGGCCAGGRLLTNAKPGMRVVQSLLWRAGRVYWSSRCCRLIALL